ncbi:MAG: hypothetical protein M0Z95_07840 [Actinomycetota bacterium]|jgi:hypothetical protein|nr:hypothetical protein [Actinomycetota bacterium]
MLTFTPTTPLEAAVLESGRFELATDTAGREVLVVGHRRLPKVVLLQKSEGLHALLDSVAATGSRSFTVSEGDPWQIEPDESEGGEDPTAAEEYLVMGLRPLTAERRPVRVASRRDVVRLYVLPWMMPAKTIGFGTAAHFVVTSARGIVGDWEVVPDGRRGVAIGLQEIWVGVLERYKRPGSELVFRCDVPVPWVSANGLADAAPAVVGVFEHSGEGDDSEETWVAKLPIVMVEGNVVHPVDVPDGIDVGEVPDGPWELEAQGSEDFSMGTLT